jgi:hypothetical protein
MVPETETLPILRRRLETQGYVMDDALLPRLDPWLRLVPFVTTFSSLMVSAPILMATAVVSFVGAILPRHPLDLVYNTLIRHIENSPELPPTSARRRAAFLAWAALLAGAAWCLHAGHVRAGLALGWGTSAMLGWLAAQQQCLVSEIIARATPKRSAPRG